MPAVVIAKSDDEIADLIDRVRSSGDLDVGLVVPAPAAPCRRPLNVRLLAQFSNQSGRRTSIVTEDPRVQQLARASGLQVYGSVPAFERGIELAAPSGRRLVGRAAPGSVAGAGGAPQPCWSRRRLRPPRHRRSARRHTLRRPRDWNRVG